MTRYELNDAYFQWMYRLVCRKKASYRNLLKHLYKTDFYEIIPMDSNRAADGIDLRYRFGDECSYDMPMIASYLDDRPCSVLEMMIALAIRCEEHIMEDSDVGDRTSQWFWDMIASLGLRNMTDSRYNEDYVDEVLCTFLEREYERTGKGGLFTVSNCPTDLRSLEIWYQMCWYLDEIT